MSEDSKSFEKKLDLDFLYYLSLTKNLYGNLTDEAHKKFCEIWLAYLFGKTCNSSAEKCDRNIFLSRLLLQMQSGKLNTNFLEPPPNGPLPCAFTAFGLPTEVDGLKAFEELGYKVDKTVGLGSSDVSESSRDGRTYLATRHLPQGIMAFLAVTNNEGEPTWVPQTSPVSVTQNAAESKAGRCGEIRSGLIQRTLLDFIEVPMCELRKSPEDRERLLEWMDKIIGDCSKWLQGEDPHNMELEQLFEMIFEEYKKDPENSELLKHPRTVRNILFRDIRSIIAERRAEISKREVVLDMYESSQYVETRNISPHIDKVWMECANKPLTSSVMTTLKANYPPTVIKRFTELLFKERLLIIQEAEKRADKRIDVLRRTILEHSKEELQKLKKAQDEYKEYYCVYKDIEEKLQDLEREYKEICGKPKEIDPQFAARCRQETEIQIQQAKQRFDKEVKTMLELRAKLDDVKAITEKENEKIMEETEILYCKIDQLHCKVEEVRRYIYELKSQREQLRSRIQNRFGT